MKRSENKSYNIQSINKHLLDILESNYYIELGNVDLQVLIRILNNQAVSLDDIVFNDILANGLGKITNRSDLDVHFQFNYLYEIHQKSSSSKFVLTCGTLRYLDKTNAEKFAPIVVVPLTLNYIKKEFIINSAPRLNTVLLRFLKKEKLLSEEQIKVLESLDTNKINSVLDIDTLCQTISEITNFPISTNNFLTTIEVEYPDYVDKKNIFGIQRSILEINDIELLEQYFKNIKSVLTSNIEQKYILLKSNSGESFVVDGRMGTGKTRTAINIMANQISRDKKVLYVNQDLDNINDLRKNLKYLGMTPFVYDLTKNVWDFEDEEELMVNSYRPFDTNVIKDLTEYRNIYNEKYHGYPYSYILEKLAIRKAQGLTEVINIEHNLDTEEVKKVYKALKEIEEHLQYIEPLGKNVWSILLSGKNAPTVEEIISNTHIFLETTKKLAKILDKTANKYNLEKIDTITNFNHLIEQMVSFTKVKPLLIWTEKDFYPKAMKALEDIAKYSDIHFSCDTYYKENCTEKYVPGTVAQHFKTITNKHYNIKDANSEDAKFLDELLNNNGHLENLTNKIKKWVDNSINTYHHIKDYFDFSEPSTEQFILLNKIHTLFSTNVIDNEWLKEYIVNPRELATKAKRLLKEYSYLLELREKLKIYLPQEELSHTALAQIINNKKFVRLIRKKINKTALKQNKMPASKIAADVKEYFEQCNLIKEELPENTALNNYDDVTWQHYVNFLDFVGKLTPFENTHLVYFIKNIIHNKTFNLKSFVELLGKLKENERELEIIENAMGRYNFAVAGTNFIESVKSIRSYIPYFDKVIVAVNEILSSYQKPYNLKTANLFSTIENDSLYLATCEHFSNNQANYKKLFGSAYKGVDTIMINIHQSVDRFIEFMKRLKMKPGIPSKNIYEALLNDSIFNDFLSNLSTFTSLYSEWFMAIREFSACFYGGKMGLQNNTFAEIIKKLTIHESKINEVEHVYQIEHILDEFDIYGLKDLSSGIRSGKYNEGVAELYLYATMHKYYNDMAKEGYKHFNLEQLKVTANNYKIEEERYCETNLNELRMKALNIKPIKKINEDVDFLVDDNLLQIKNLVNTKNIFISDVDTFNKISDLSFFDLVLIDDAHLSTANKYSNLQYAKQVIAFGDKAFQTSVTNTLMQRMKKGACVSLHKRYVEMKSEFYNLWQNDNQYIYSPKLLINVSSFKNLENMIQKVVQEYKKYKDTDEKRTINIVVYSFNTRREVYSLLINNLINDFSLEEVLKITNYGIRIISANGESTRLCDSIYLWYDDLVKLDPVDKDLVRRNYVLAKKDINVCYQTESSIEQKEILASIKEFIGDPHSIEHSLEGITKIMFEKLINKNIDVELGPGYIDLIIKKKSKNIGIILYGKRTDNSYSIIDDYLYYVFEYQKRGWDIYLYCMEDLFEKFEQVIEEIITISKQEKK